MPVVPTVDAPTVAPTASTGTPYNSGAGNSPDAFGAGIGAAEQRLGGELDKFGGVMQKHALDMQNRVNQTLAKDMFLQSDIEVGKLTTDFNSLQGLNRTSAYDKYVQDLQAVREKALATAPNQEVKHMFDQDFSRRMGFSIVDGARQSAAALREVNKATSKAVLDNTMQHIAASANDDTRFKSELEFGLQTVEQEKTQQDGSSPEVIDSAKKSYESSAWATRLSVMSKNDPFRAEKLFKENKDSMDGLTQEKVKQTVTQGIIQVGSKIEGDKIAQEGLGVSPELTDKVKKLEGYREKPYSDGRQTSSGYGTKVQPGDENLSSEQLKAAHEVRITNELGRAAGLVDNFAPNLPKGTRDALISLTYNAGADWMSAGLGNAVKSGDMTAAQAKILEYNKFQGETNAGLQTRRAQEASWFGGETEDRGQGGDASLVKQLARAKEIAQRQFPDDPGAAAQYEATLGNRLQTQLNQQKSAVSQMNIVNRNTVLAETTASDVAKRPMTLEQLSPAAQQSYSLMGETDKASVRRQLDNNSKADVPLTIERRQRELSLYGLAKTEPDKFMAVDLASQDLTQVQRQTLSKMQFDRKKLLQDSADTTRTISSLSVVTQLNDAKIFASRTDAGANERYQTFIGAFSAQKAAIESETKKPLSEKEAGELTAKLLRQQVMSKGTLWDTKGPTYETFKTPIALSGTTEEELNAAYKALPSGVHFTGPDGQKRFKR